MEFVSIANYNKKAIPKNKNMFYISLHTQQIS